MAKIEKFSIIKLLKLFSGRVALTIVSCVALIMIVYTFCQILIQKQSELSIDNLFSMFNSIILIVSNVVTFYFTKQMSSGTNREPDD